MKDIGPSPAARLDLDAMRAAVAIAEATSVTLAASRLGRTPAAVSMQLKKLEETLGTPLFNRTRQGMTPTPAGERLMPFARRLVETERAAREAFLAEPLTGKVRLGLIDDVSSTQLTAMLAAFARSHPQVTVDVAVGPTAALTPQLDRGDLDLALIAPGGTGQAWRGGDLLLAEEPLVWVGPRDGPGNGAPWQDRPLPLALAAEGCGWRRVMLEALGRAEIPYRIAYQSEFTSALTAAVIGGLAVSVMPPSAMPEGVRVIGPADGAPALGSTRIALRRAPMLSPAAEALAERIAESFGAALPGKPGA